MKETTLTKSLSKDDITVSATLIVREDGAWMLEYGGNAYTGWLPQRLFTKTMAEVDTKLNGMLDDKIAQRRGCNSLIEEATSIGFELQ